VFYVAVALMMLGFNAVAFAPQLFDPSLRRMPLPLTPLVTAHAVVSVAWLLLFLSQAGLVATGRTQVHRRVGMLGIGLAVLFVVLGYLTTVSDARRGFDLGGNFDRLPPVPGPFEPAAAQLGVLYLFVQFAVLVGVAFWHRTNPAIHKRLMLVALLGPLVPTPIAHLIGGWIGPQPWANLLFPVGQALILSLVLVHDHVTEGRIHPVSLWACLLVYVSDMIFNFVVIPSASWIRFSDWLVG
jgi:uncharacterized membrane protein YozB (DUF420 family)